MIASLPDLFFSFRGSIDRRAWALGLLSVLLALAGGVYLFNNDSYDESANAVRNAPTMGAFLWALVCVAAIAALNVKRLNARGRPRWIGLAVGVIGLAIVCAWGLGLFPDPLSASLSGSLLLAALSLPILVALADCALDETQ